MSALTNRPIDLPSRGNESTRAHGSQKRNRGPQQKLLPVATPCERSISGLTGDALPALTRVRLLCSLLVIFRNNGVILGSRRIGPDIRFFHRGGWFLHDVEWAFIPSPDDFSWEASLDFAIFRYDPSVH